MLVQYTALAWSSRGFPRRFLTVLRILRAAGARIAIVFHDVAPFGGTRLIDRVRRAYQFRMMRAARSFADITVLTVALDLVPWLATTQENATFIPVGANLPLAFAQQDHTTLHSPPMIGVYGITGGVAGERETRDIVATLRYAAQHLGALRLSVFGRHADLHEKNLLAGLQGCPVECTVEGVVKEKDLAGRFAAIDVLLFVRGTVSSRRGSAIAGIACGVPVIAFRGDETAAPITDAGVLLLNEESNDAARQLQLGESLVDVLSDHQLRADLIARNLQAQNDHFSWPAIAKRYATLLRSTET